MTDVQLLSIGEAMKLLSLSKTTVFSLIKDGRIKVVKLGRRTLIPRAEVVRLATPAN